MYLTAENIRSLDDIILKWNGKAKEKEVKNEKKRPGSNGFESDF